MNWILCWASASAFVCVAWHLFRSRAGRSLDRRLAPHLPSDLDIRLADYRVTSVTEADRPAPGTWAAMSSARWPR